MQTFLPVPNFELSAKALDNKRLGKQRVECKQILRALLGETRGWINHPATKMWRGHEQSLCRYAIAVCNVWIERGFNDSLLSYFKSMHDKLPACEDPSWIGGDIHASHRSNLLRKNSFWYAQFGWTEDSTQPYVWPTNNWK